MRQALQDSLADIDQPSLQRSSPAVLEHLDRLHHLVTVTQRTKNWGPEVVDELGKLPGMLKLSDEGSSAFEAEAQWLMSLLSGTHLPGTSP